MTQQMTPLRRRMIEGMNEMLFVSVLGAFRTFPKAIESTEVGGSTDQCIRAVMAVLCHRSFAGQRGVPRAPTPRPAPWE
jgi:hypothetical protein